jgi:ribose-phosphate pyrophosphokinase
MLAYRMIIIGCSRGVHIAKKVARRLKKPYSELNVKKFPDGELYMRFMSNIRGKVVVLVQSFHGNINDEIVEIIFAAETAKDLGARKVILVAPYFPYFRQDKRFKPGGCISIKVMGKLISHYFDKVLVVDPHLHRQNAISRIFSIQTDKLTSNTHIANYIKKNIKKPLIVGPDWESYKWAEKVADKVGCQHVIMEKTRISGRKVIVKLNKKIDIKDKNVVIIDDIISTGNTIIEAVKNIKKLGAKKFTCIAVHGIFVEKALEKLRKANIKVITTNTIPNKVSKIDISKLVAEGLKK